MIHLKKKDLLFYTLLIFVTINVNAQSNGFKTQRAQFAVFNIGINGLIGGIGSIINKKDDKTSFQTFAKGFYKGAIGGGISHIGLSMTNLVIKHENIAYAWPAKLVNSLGSSIVQNAAEDKKMFERLHFNLYVARFEYYTYQKKFKARLFTSSIYGIAVAGNGANFDLNKTLKSGIIYLESNSNFSSSIGSGVATGLVSSIGMRSDIVGNNYYSIYAHELAHILQFDRMVVGNAFVYRLDKKLKNSLLPYKKISKYIYFDLNGPLFWLAYKIEGSPHNCNLFEQEAENYSNRRAYICR